jgi:hypothetical protein
MKPPMKPYTLIQFVLLEIVRACLVDYAHAITSLSVWHQTTPLAGATKAWDMLAATVTSPNVRAHNSLLVAIVATVLLPISAVVTQVGTEQTVLFLFANQSAPMENVQDPIAVIVPEVDMNIVSMVLKFVGVMKMNV